MTPQRIQLRRTKGWRKPKDAVVVARPSRWGNPYRVRGRWVYGPHGGEHDCAPGEAHGVAVRLFREDLYTGRLDFTTDDVLLALHGRDLACWCPPGKACHADVLLELANPPQPEGNQ